MRPCAAIADEQRRPERQGLFGLLSVGFVAAALLTVLGFLLYALFSFRRRIIELGILRAIGLSAGQMTSFLAWELAFLILTGLVAGTVLGAWISNLFIPYLQVGTGPAAAHPALPGRDRLAGDLPHLHPVRPAVRGRLVVLRASCCCA